LQRREIQILPSPPSHTADPQKLGTVDLCKNVALTSKWNKIAKCHTLRTVASTQYAHCTCHFLSFQTLWMCILSPAVDLPYCPDIGVITCLLPRGDQQVNPLINHNDFDELPAYNSNNVTLLGPNRFPLLQPRNPSSKQLDNWDFSLVSCTPGFYKQGLPSHFFPISHFQGLFMHTSSKYAPLTFPGRCLEWLPLLPSSHPRFLALQYLIIF
jgi:hypothetical protein